MALLPPPLFCSTHVNIAVNVQISCKKGVSVLYYTGDRQAWWTAMLLCSLCLKFLFTFPFKACMVPGWGKVNTGCNLPVSFVGLGLIISPHHAARIMLTLAVLMKKLHLQLSEDIRLIWPLQIYLLHANPHLTLGARIAVGASHLIRRNHSPFKSSLKWLPCENRGEKNLHKQPFLQLCLASSVNPNFKMSFGDAPRRLKTSAIKGSRPAVDERRSFIRH